MKKIMIVGGLVLSLMLVSSILFAEDGNSEKGFRGPSGVIMEMGHENQSLILDNGMRVLMQGVFSITGKDGKDISSNMLHRGDRVAVVGEMGIDGTLFASRIVLLSGPGQACSTSTEREHEHGVRDK